MGCLSGIPIGCIAGVRYNESYGFIGLFLVLKKYRGNGYGVSLWKHALSHLESLPCIGLEAATDRITDYQNWGFEPSSYTTRWHIDCHNLKLSKDYINSLNEDHYYNLRLLEGTEIPDEAVHLYDARREPSPRPHFLSDWLHNSSGKVLALVDLNGLCHGFGRIRPCLLNEGKGWRIGPLLADSAELAKVLMIKLIRFHQGSILIDSPGLNPKADSLFEELGFIRSSKTLRMYKGSQPIVNMRDVYGLACLELG